MEYRDRSGNVVRCNDGQDKLLKKLYGTISGRRLVKILIHPVFSRMAGRLLDSRLSRVFICPFVRRNAIDMEQYEKKSYSSYNDFFVRSVKSEKRPIQTNPKSLISPCDAKLTVYPITKSGRFCIKHTVYSMESLLKNEELAARYEGGLLCVFRLTVDDYHRFCYVDSGRKSANIKIPGMLHTVNPIANDVYPIYKENAREYCLLKTENFGTVLMMEVGALMVGRIVNYHGACSVIRGQEKGRFEFGGSTVVLALEKGRVRIDEDILENSRENVETIVCMGEKIAESI